MKPRPGIDTGRARIYYGNGEVQHFTREVFAFAIWLALPKGTRAAFRSANDRRPVRAWNLVDRV